MLYKNKFSLISISSFLMMSCFFDGESLDKNSTIKEAPVSAFDYPNTEIFLEDSASDTLEGPQVLLKQNPPSEVGFKLTLTAQLKAVSVDGIITQASDVIKWGDYAVVAYNTAGAEYRGALQWVADFKKDSTDNKNPPKIDREIHLSDVDVNVLYMSGNILYVGGAADPVKYGGISYISWMDAKKGQASDLIKNQKIFGSFGVTGIAEKKGSIYITTGAENGALLELKDKSLDSIASWSRSDLRSIAIKGDDLYVLAGTTDGAETKSGIYKHDISKSKFEEIYSFASFGSDYHRAEISVLENKLVVGALGQVGFKIWDADNSFSEEWSYTLPILSPYKISANGLETDSKYLFMAMGEWGIEIHELPDSNNDFKKSVALGRINFIAQKDDKGQNLSANHLVYETNRLLVAAGSGGLKIYDLEEL